MIALLLKGTRAVRKPPSASTATFPSGNAQLHVHSALGPHGWGRVTMATLQSSLSDSFTMYNRSVYRKNADRIFWFSSVLLTRKECRAHQKKRSARCRFPGRQLKLPPSWLGSPVHRSLKEAWVIPEGHDCPIKGPQRCHLASPEAQRPRNCALLWVWHL